MTMKLEDSVGGAQVAAEAAAVDTEVAVKAPIARPSNAVGLKMILAAAQGVTTAEDTAGVGWIMAAVKGERGRARPINTVEETTMIQAMAMGILTNHHQ